MPSPVGHFIAGIGAAWAVDLAPGARTERTAAPTASFFRRAGGLVTVVCGVLGALPDIDLLFGSHRTGTHSLLATLLVTIVAALVTGWVTTVGRRDGRSAARAKVIRIALMCGAAYGSHLVLDWVAVDRNPPAGFQLLWPFSHAWFISGLDFFPQTERRRFLSWPSIQTNLVAIAWESATLLPVLALLWLVRVKTLARFAAQLSGRDHAP